MTALSTAFIAPCSPKLRFYVDVRVTVAVKTTNQKTNAAPLRRPVNGRRRSPLKKKKRKKKKKAYVSLASVSLLIWRWFDKKFKLMFSRISFKYKFSNSLFVMFNFGRGCRGQTKVQTFVGCFFGFISIITLSGWF